jgi:hypothetical protein
MRTAHEVVTAALLTAIAAAGLAISNYPARGQSDQWEQLLNPVKAEPQKKRGPRFYIKRKKRAEIRRVVTRTARQAGVAANAAYGSARAVESPPTEAARAFFPIVIRTIRIEAPFAGAFHIRRDELAPLPPPLPDIPLREHPAFKRAAVGVLVAAFTATVIYGAWGGKHA